MVKGGLAEWGECFRTISLDQTPRSLAHKKGTFAVSLYSGQIAIFDAITGSQMAVLHGHTELVRSITFSLDGTFLVSGGDDKIVKLWDVQTGGVVRTFCGHIYGIHSVAISLDCITIASGCRCTILLWHAQTGDSFCVIDGLNHQVTSLNFSPTNSQLLLSATHDGNVQQWGLDGCQIGPTHEGRGAAFSLDGTNFVSWGGQVATVRNSNSRVVVAELHVSSGNFKCCCFSPDGKFVAGCAGYTSYIWDITGLDPHLIKSLIGHKSVIIALIFPSSLISVSHDITIKFWQTGTPSTDPGPTGTESTPSKSSPIESVSLQVKDGIAISSDLAGVVKTWNILTGLCKASFQTPAPSISWRDAQLIEGRLIIVWHEDQELCILSRFSP